MIQATQIQPDKIYAGDKRVPCEVYSRIVGYIRPVKQWNVGKIQEWKERKVYDAEKAIDGCQESE